MREWSAGPPLVMPTWFSIQREARIVDGGEHYALSIPDHRLRCLAAEWTLKRVQGDGGCGNGPASIPRSSC